MELTNNNDIIEVILSPNEFWWLAKFFSPGAILGVKDPTEGLSEEEIKEAESVAIDKLIKAKVINTAKDGTLQMDDLLGAIIYSCIHSTNALVLTLAQLERRFYHFLPDWQLELVRIGDNYQLSCFKNREALVDYILRDLVTIKNITPISEESFSIPSRDLELSVFLFQSGKPQKAIEEFSKSCIGLLSDPRSFIEGYLNPSTNVDIEMVFNKEGEKIMHQCHYSVMEINNMLYWITHTETIGDEPVPIIYFNTMKTEDVKNKLLMMIGS